VAAVVIFTYLRSRSSSPGYAYTPPRLTEQQAWAAFKSSLKQYKDLHKGGVESMRKSGHVRTLTTTCSLKMCNGLGDQLFRIEFAFLLALMSDRVFVIHWDDSLRERTKHIVHNQVNWDVFNGSLGMCSTDEDNQCRSRVYDRKSIFGFSWTEAEYSLFGKALFGPEQHITIANFYVNSIFIGDNSMMRAGRLMEEGFEKLGVKTILAKNRYNEVDYYRKAPDYSALEWFGLTGLFGIQAVNNGHVQATDAWIQMNHVIFHYLFTFRNDLLTQVEQMKTALQLNTQPYLAVHLRTGFVGSPHVESFKARQWQFKNWKLFDESVWPCILSHSINLADRLIGSNAPIYVATDSTVARDWATNLYGSRIRSSTLVPTHFAQGDKNADDVSSWVDFLILGGSRAMVHGDSSYATNAAFLRPIPIAMQSWIMQDSARGCMVSHVGSNVTCVC
ncbi:hypothetical protein EMCRGX_G001956, partial [Ephydatia muelleri]